MLIASEVFEAFAAYRDKEFYKLPEEIADVTIRIMDFCEAYDIDLEWHVRRKHEINKGRPYRHGGKLC